MLRLILSDLRAKANWCYRGTSVRDLVKVLLSDGTTAMILYRLMQGSRRWRLTLFEALFNKLNSVLCSCIIGRGAEFGPGFVMIHATGIVINGHVRGGERVFLQHQVTLGVSLGTDCPVLGNDIFIGAGAKVIGKVRVGNGARIGANAVVVHDVPEQSTVVGIPAKVVQKKRLSTRRKAS